MNFAEARIREGGFRKRNRFHFFQPTADSVEMFREYGVPKCLRMVVGSCSALQPHQ